MKIAHYEQIITPEVGEPVAGYGVNDVTVRIHDDLKLSVLLLDDGETKGAVLGYDLLGQIPMDPKLAALVDRGMLELMENDYLDSAVKVIENRLGSK